MFSILQAALSILRDQRGIWVVSRKPYPRHLSDGFPPYVLYGYGRAYGTHYAQGHT